MQDWFLTSGENLIGVLLSVIGIYVVLIVLLRIAGLRSFSKMSSFDFAVTVAIGSVLASTVITKNPPLVQAAFALVCLFAAQYSISLLRKRTRWMEHLVDNEPIVLMAGDRMLHDNMKRSRVTENDLWAKLREANVLDPKEVWAVVLEATGDISVLHGVPDGPSLHPCLLSGVRDSQRVDLDKVDDYAV